MQAPTTSAAHDTCVRCGKPTPLGVALCEADNPARIGGPSATQVHGTIFIGVVLGFLALATAARLALAGVGPFEATITSARPNPDGSIEVSLRVTNAGQRDAAPSCRITRGGISGGEDLIFLTETLPAGATVELQRTLPAPRPPARPYDPGTLVPLCR